MYTATEIEALKNRLKAEGKSKAEIIQAISAACLGWPYVFGAWGCMCTPGNRTEYADLCEKKHPEYAEKIRKACPVLSGKQSTCTGCPWDGVRCFDCRGFTHWLLEQVGLQLYGDTVGTQWETKSNWAVQGEIADMPKDLACCIFRKGHTGTYLGDGITRHCSTIVKEEPMPGTPKWLQFGIPAGLYSTEELRKAGVDVDENRNVPTLRRGAKGELVQKLQAFLLGAGYGNLLADDNGNPVDGIFGAKTEAAVKEFQRSNGLAVDGIVGPKTWAAMGGAPEDDDFPDEPEEPEEPDAHPPDGEMVSVPRGWLLSIAQTFEEIALDIREYLGQP